jgi:dihydrodipicolinate synthase/N-acetylneuraminate lyase
MMDVADADRRTLLKSLALTAAAVGVAGKAVAAPPPRTRKQLQGLFPIAFTPVAANDRVDMDGLANQVTFCRRGGVHGIAWPQIASGWTTLSERERLDGAEAMLAAAKGGRTSVVIGVQSPEFAAVERYAKHAERNGADAVICIPPQGVSDPNALLDYYQKVGGMTALPLFVQAVGDMSVDLLVRMFETIPTFRYVKDEAGEPLERIAELRRRTSDRLNVFSGRGVGTMISEMELGFKGHCPFVSLSDVYASAFDLWHAGREQEAFVRFGAIQAASTMLSQSSIDVLIARGVFKPGTRTRTAPPAPGSTPANRFVYARGPEAVSRVLKTYLTPYLRA